MPGKSCSGCGRYLTMSTTDGVERRSKLRLTGERLYYMTAYNVCMTADTIISSQSIQQRHSRREISSVSYILSSPRERERVCVCVIEQYKNFTQGNHINRLT